MSFSPEAIESRYMSVHALRVRLRPSSERTWARCGPALVSGGKYDVVQHLAGPPSSSFQKRRLHLGDAGPWTR